MPTLLVTRRMSPELRARVEASVRGRRPGVSRRSLPSLRAGLRVGIAAAVIGLVALVWTASRRARAELEAERAAVFERVEREGRAFPEEQRRIRERVAEWLVGAAGPYRGDSIAAELRGQAALDAVLARPAVYARGSLAGFASPGTLAASASSSYLDAFVLCLYAPPRSRSEKALLGRARSAHGGAVAKEAPQVARLGDALQVLPLLAPGFVDRVHSAKHLRELDLLSRELERAPFERARAAARAELLLFALDEPGDASVPAELDGERPHAVRVGLVDLTARKTLLALRRQVDPGNFSAAARAEFAHGLDSCALSLDVRAAVAERGG